MESVPVGYEDRIMDFITTIGAIVTGVATVAVGVYSLAAIWFEDLT